MEIQSKVVGTAVARARIEVNTRMADLGQITTLACRRSWYISVRRVGNTFATRCSAVLIAGAKQKMDDYYETPAERGQMGSLTFLRFSFQGKEKGPVPFKGHAIVYHAHDRQQYIHLMIVDSEPHHAESFPLVETAARTFQKP